MALGFCSFHPVLTEPLPRAPSSCCGPQMGAPDPGSPRWGEPWPGLLLAPAGLFPAAIPGVLRGHPRRCWSLLAPALTAQSRQHKVWVCKGTSLVPPCPKPTAPQPPVAPAIARPRWRRGRSLPTLTPNRWGVVPLATPPSAAQRMSECPRQHPRWKTTTSSFVLHKATRMLLWLFPGISAAQGDALWCRTAPGERKLLQHMKRNRGW